MGKYSFTGKAGLRMPKRGSGQEERMQRSAGGDGMGGGTQTAHMSWYDAEDIADALGVSKETAEDFYHAVSGNGEKYGDDAEGGFTFGWDNAIRHLQRGASENEILSLYGAREAIDTKFGGDKNAYMDMLRKKSADVERLIDASPKWQGGETFRGFKNMPASKLAELTTVGNVVDLNNGTASWTSNENVARRFASSGQNSSFVAHVSAGTRRRGTSIKNISLFNSEDEILCSKNEQFICTRTERRNGRLHAYYELVDTNYRWKY